MNLPLILFLILLVTGLAWLADGLWLRKRRAEGAAEPWWIDWSKSFFPVILVVFALRSFLIEPFNIPSSSMRPLLEVGDFILVNKFAYGIRLPILDKKVIDVGTPQRGDVVVFRHPREPGIDLIKTLIAGPGETIAYRNKQLTINGQPMAQTSSGSYSYLETGLSAFGPVRFATQRLTENLGGKSHTILHDPQRYSFDLFADEPALARQHCRRLPDGLECTVPAGHYFLMGDNRDNSSDGRKWGFAPEDHIRGKAFFVWFNFALDKSPMVDFGRIGTRL